MPYIKKIARECLKLNGFQAEDVGELNYCFTEIINRYIEGTLLSYKLVNDVLGALEGAKLEFYARIARPLEEQKIKENGDVYNDQRQEHRS